MLILSILFIFSLYHLGVKFFFRFPLPHSLFFSCFFSFSNFYLFYFIFYIISESKFWFLFLLVYCVFFFHFYIYFIFISRGSKTFSSFFFNFLFWFFPRFLPVKWIKKSAFHSEGKYDKRPKTKFKMKVLLDLAL